MTTSNALTKEQLTTALGLMDKMEQMGTAVSRLEVNFGGKVAGELVREGTKIVFVPDAGYGTGPYGSQDTYPYSC